MTHGKRQREKRRELKRLLSMRYEVNRYDVPQELIKPTFWQKVKKWITKLIS